MMNMEVDDGWPWGPVQDERGAAGGPTESQVPPKVSFCGSHCSSGETRPAPFVIGWLVGCVLCALLKLLNPYQNSKRFYITMWVMSCSVAGEVWCFRLRPLSQCSSRGHSSSGAALCCNSVPEVTHQGDPHRSSSFNLMSLPAAFQLSKY